MKPATPITDAEAARADDFYPRTEVVNADTARALELDREALMAALEVYLMAGHKEARRAASVQAKATLTAARANFPTP